MKWLINPAGDLQIDVTPEEQAILRTNREENPDEWSSDRVMYEELEGLVTNDEYDWVQPEWIDGLTDAPLLGTFGETRPVTDEDGCYQCAGRWDDADGVLTTYMNPVLRAWKYEPYALRSPLDDLADEGRCIFTLVYYVLEQVAG